MRIKSLKFILLTGFISWAVFFPTQIDAKPTEKIKKSKQKQIERNDSQSQVADSVYEKSTKKIRKSKRKQNERNDSQLSTHQQVVDSVYAQDSTATEQSDSEKISVDSVLAQILCPNCDDDDDGILNLFDACPNIPGTAKKYGCPQDFNFARTQIVRISFSAGKTEIPNSSQVYLLSILKKLKEKPSSKIRIYGYTDNTGEYEDNVKISQKRAESVKDYLVSKGINGERIATAGFGPNKPIADNRTENGRRANRRIEVYWD